MDQTPDVTAPDSQADLPVQMRVRREKRERILRSGRDAYPVEVGRTHTLSQVREAWGHLETGEETTDVVVVAGRIIFIRNTGKLAFATLQEGAGTRLQVMLSVAEVGEEACLGGRTSWTSATMCPSGAGSFPAVAENCRFLPATGSWHPRRSAPSP